MSCFVVVFSESKCMTEQKKKSWYYTPLYNFSKITTRVCISEVLMRKKSKNAKLLLPFLKSSEAKQAWMKSAGMWIVENKIRIIIYKKKSQFFGRTIWMLVLCSEESAAVRHALGQRLALRRQVPLSARTFPCTGHTLPWHSKGVALVLSPVSSTPVNAPLLFIGSHVRLCFPKQRQQRRQRQQTRRGRGAPGTQRTTQWLRGTDKSGADSVLMKEEKTLPLSAILKAAVLACLLARSLSLPVVPPEWDWPGQVFQRLDSGEDPAHSVETLGRSSAERASSKQRRCSGEQAASGSQSARRTPLKTRHGLPHTHWPGV